MYADAILNVFSQRYSDARSAFKDATSLSTLVAHVEEFLHPEKGPKKEKLSCDVVWMGSRKAEKILVLVSGIHGVEGGVGSAIQSDFANRYKRLPANVAVVLIHAVNPWGFAWAKRTDHQNIDVNRNFIDFDSTLPQSDLGDVWQQLASGEVSFSDLAKDNDQFERISQGQYEQAEAPFFGGTQASWSREVIEQVIKKITPSKRQQIIVLDIHSGLGNYGYGELICDHPADTPAFDLAYQLFGKTVVAPVASNTQYGAKTGLHDYIWHQQGEHVCFLTLEFGTYGNDNLLSVLSQDQQSQLNNKKDQSKQAMLDFFCPDEKQWKELVLFRGRQVIEIALAELSKED